jgi:hypothetical protein
MRSTFLTLLGSTSLLAAASTIVARRRWSFVAGACLVASLALWLKVGVGAAFVAATLGVLAWFWDQRNRFKASIIEDTGETEVDADIEEDRDDGEADGGEDVDEVRATGETENFETRESDNFERRPRS